MKNNDTMMRLFERVYLDSFGIQYDEFTLNFYVYFDNYGKFSCSKYISEIDFYEKVYFDDIQFEEFFDGRGVQIKRYYNENTEDLERVDVIFDDDTVITFRDDDFYYICSIEQLQFIDLFLKTSNRSYVSYHTDSIYIKDDLRYLTFDIYFQRWYSFNGTKKLKFSDKDVEIIRQLLKVAFIEESIVKIRREKRKISKIIVDLPSFRLILYPDGSFDFQLDNLDVLDGQETIEDYINVKE